MEDVFWMKLHGNVHGNKEWICQRFLIEKHFYAAVIQNTPANNNPPTPPPTQSYCLFIILLKILRYLRLGNHSSFVYQENTWDLSSGLKSLKNWVLEVVNPEINRKKWVRLRIFVLKSILAFWKFPSNSAWHVNIERALEKLFWYVLSTIYFYLKEKKMRRGRGLVASFSKEYLGKNERADGQEK